MVWFEKKVGKTARQFLASPLAVMQKAHCNEKRDNNNINLFTWTNTC